MWAKFSLIEQSGLWRGELGDVDVMKFVCVMLKIVGGFWGPVLNMDDLYGTYGCLRGYRGGM